MEVPNLCTEKPAVTAGFFSVFYLRFFTLRTTNRANQTDFGNISGKIEHNAADKPNARPIRRVNF